MKKDSGVNHSLQRRAITRRSKVIIARENQLKVGTKVDKTTKEIVNLSEQDINRIKKEIETLKQRLSK